MFSSATRHQSLLACLLVMATLALTLAGARVRAQTIVGGCTIKPGTYCEEARMDHAGLKGANLSGADLGEAHLGGAQLQAASLVGADLYETDFAGADLSGADLTGATLAGYGQFDNANLTARDCTMPISLTSPRSS